MEATTENEMRTLLVLLKEILVDYNASNMGKKLGLSAMGSLKILKKLEKQKLLKAKKMGKAVFYKPNFSNNYALDYFQFLLQKEAEECEPRVKRWVEELKKLQKNAEIGILFGSVLKRENYNDVDLLLVFRQSQNKEINRIVTEINHLSSKKVNAVKQTKQDFKNNLEKKDRVVVNAVKDGVVVFGYNNVVEAIKNVPN